MADRQAHPRVTERNAPPGMFRTLEESPSNMFKKVPRDHSPEDLHRLFKENPETMVYNSEGKRVGPDGQPIGMNGIL